MEAQLFLTINRKNTGKEWNKSISAALNANPAISSVLVIETNENNEVQVNINYNIQMGSVDYIEQIIRNSGAFLTGLNIHLPAQISGTADPYGASAIALPLQDELGKIDGITGISISSGGVIKLEMDVAVSNKELKLEEMLNAIAILRSGAKKS